MLPADDVLQEFGRHLRAMRKEQQLTIEALAARAGLSSRAVSYVMSQRSVAAQLKKLCCSADNLVTPPLCVASDPTTPTRHPLILLHQRGNRTDASTYCILPSQIALSDSYISGEERMTSPRIVIRPSMTIAAHDLFVSEQTKSAEAGGLSRGLGSMAGRVVALLASNTVGLTRTQLKGATGCSTRSLRTVLSKLNSLTSTAGPLLHNNGHNIQLESNDDEVLIAILDEVALDRGCTGIAEARRTRHKAERLQRDEGIQTKTTTRNTASSRNLAVVSMSRTTDQSGGLHMGVVSIETPDFASASSPVCIDTLEATVSTIGDQALDGARSPDGAESTDAA